MVLDNADANAKEPKRNSMETSIPSNDLQSGLCLVCSAPIPGEATKCQWCGVEYHFKDTKKGRVRTPVEKEGELKQNQKNRIIRSFSEVLGIGNAKSKLLYENGYKNLIEIKNATNEDLAKIETFDKALINKIRARIDDIYSEKSAYQSISSGARQNEITDSSEKSKSNHLKDEEQLAEWLRGKSSETSLSDWLGEAGKGKEAKSKRKKESLKKQIPTPSTYKADPNIDALKRWLTGEEENAINEWLGETSAQIPKDVKIEPKTEQISVEIADKETPLKTKEQELKKREMEIEKERIGVEELKKAIATHLEKLKKGDFDPLKLIEDNASLNKELQTEIIKRKGLEEEIEHIKKGSLAVIKYMKAQQSKLKEEELKDLKRKLAEEQTNRDKISIEINRKEEEVLKLKKQLETEIHKLPADTKVLKQKEIEFIEKETNLKAKEEELKLLEKNLAEKEKNIAAASGEQAGKELRARLEEELREKERDFIDKENQLKKRILELEEEVQKFKIDEKLRAESKELMGKESHEISAELMKKEQELLSKEKSLLLRENEIQRLREELRFKEDEFKRLKEPLMFKEDELLRREEDLRYREERLAAEARKVEEAKAQVGTLDQQQMKKQLETLEKEIQVKEEELRNREKYLSAKMEELKLKEKGIVEEEITLRQEERELEVKTEKIKTGTPRLDDLLFGGIPFGSNVLIYGPPFVGKEVLVNTFVAEGLVKGVPVIWVITDKTIGGIREDMSYILPSYQEYERRGLIHYIDAYSRSMGETSNEPNTVYIEQPTDTDAILSAVDSIAKELKKKNTYYRLAFESVSTIIAYLDPTTTFKFLQPFCGRRKRDKAVSLFTIEKGMHSETDISMLGHIMDGTIDFKVEQLNTFLSVKGICETQSRAYISYTHTKKGLSIGSFSLGHIR